MSVFAGSALLCGTARADLTLTDMFIVSGWDPMTGEPIFVEDGEAFSITSEQDQLQFWVRVKLASRTGPTNISGNQLVVTGNPLLNFQLTSRTGSTVIRRTASYTGITDYDPTDGEAMYMLFAYTPQATDYYHGVSLAYGGTALINLGTGGSIATDEPSDGSLPVSASGQLPGSTQLQQDFNANSANVEINMYRITTDADTVDGVEIPAGSDQLITILRADEANTASMTVNFSIADRTIASIATQSATIGQGSSAPVSIAVTGVNVGTTTLTATVAGHTDQTVTIPIRVTKSGTAALIQFSPETVTLGEGSSQQVQVQLGSAATQNTTFTVTGGDPAELQYSDSFIVTAGASVGYINVTGVDGPQNATTYNLTVTDESGEYLMNAFPVTVTNIPPTLVYPSTDSANPSMASGVANETITLSASAIDPADPLTYTWTMPNGNRVVGQTADYTFDAPGEYMVTVEVSDGDGGTAVGYLEVTVEEAVTVVFTDEYPSRKSLPGWAEATFTILQPANKTWNEEGNSFRPNSAIRVQAHPEAGTYPLCWARDSTDYNVGNNVLTVPNANTTISLNAPAEGVQTIYFIASHPFHDTDTFGDIDQDGLSDGWEMLYLAGENAEATSDTLMTLPLAINSGDYAATGNPDSDTLPTSSTMIVPDPNNAGWQVEVFRYPLSCAAGDVTYAVGPGKEPFNNQREYRGLREDRDNGNGLRYYSTEYGFATEPERGNSPGTNPTLADSDEDGFEDGWEFYFWTTIMYEVNSDSWRAYDPTFQTYDPENPDTSGIRLLDVYDKDCLLTMFDPMAGYIPAPDPAPFEAAGYDLSLWDIAADIDNDGLTLYEEYLLGTDPLHWDTDRDGMPDGWEVFRGLEPLDPRNNLNGAGPNDNPDNDKMALSGGFKHALAYIYDWENNTYWNGSASLPFNPAMVTDGANFSNLEEFLFAQYLYENGAGPMGGVYPSDWANYTTNPLDNDTNKDGIPDGWEAYVGYSPIQIPNPGPIYEVGVDLYALKYGAPMPEALHADPDRDELDLYAEFDNATTAPPADATPVPWIDGTTVYGTVINVGNGGTNGVSQAITRYFPWDSTNRLNAAWTNKRLPTDPYNEDTDGDSLPDNLEYEGEDTNGDGSKIVNFDPTSADTDRDWLPDAWEYLFGTYDLENAGDGPDPNDPFGPWGDPDGDGLPNYQEYLTASVYGWRYDYFYHADNPDYFMPDSAKHNAYPYADSYAFRPYQPMDFFRPAPNPVEMANAMTRLEELETEVGLDASSSPSIGGTDKYSVIQRAYEVLRSDSIGTDDFILMSYLMEAAANLDFSYGGVPATWDRAYFADRDLEVVYNYIRPKFIGTGGFPGTSPRSVDTDSDSMEDYWEVFHGINPLYGGAVLGNVAGTLVDSDRADNHIYGDGSTDNWIMNSSPVVNRVLTPVMGVPMPVSREATAFYNTLFDLYYAEAAHYDLVRRPWLSGDRFADLDHDGLNNQEESYNHLASSVLHHTDPSPYWLTDASNPQSHVNLYYSTAGLAEIWLWDRDINGGVLNPPEYMFSFETNEGFDTDNDNLNDIEELSSHGDSIYADPLDVDTPRARKALYLNGNAAARTRNPFFHDRWAMTSYTVEFWFRAQLPANGQTQTLIHRPVFMPTDDMSDATYWNIRNTFLIELDPEGHVTARVDNDALETVSSAQVISGGRIVPNVWNHVAVTMDAANDRFSLYLNGELSDSVRTALKPCNGTLLGASYTINNETGTGTMVSGTVTNVTAYSFSPAPIVIGGYDKNPWGIVSGMGNTQPDFDDSRFYTGWIDEVRIWDQARSQTEILNNMTKRFSKADILPINQARFAWEMENIATIDNITDFPQQLLYHFSFDTLPDVLPGADRDTTEIPDSDITSRPKGWDAIDNDNPLNSIPWWERAADRSAVYGPQYDYIPVIENTVAHLPQHPAVDMMSLRANYDTNTWEVLSYRYRYTSDWLLDVLDNMAIFTNGVSDVKLSQVKNSMNPYGMVYYTAAGSSDAINPFAFSGELGLLSEYQAVPLHSDLLPLRDAIGDIDVEMWDGKGAGFENVALDSDGDGLPDWWEVAHGLDPYDATGINGAYGDADGDGLDNYAEYLAGTNPNSADSDSDGYTDYYSRKDGTSLTYGEMYDDGDGMPNDWEIQYGLDPDRFDAYDDLDEDGWTNLEEYQAGTNPADARYYPTPKMNVTYYYNGVNNTAPFLQLLTYAEKTAGDNMGGHYDGRYYTTATPVDLGSGVTGDDGYGFMVNGRAYYASYLPYSGVTAATITIGGQSYTAEEWNDELGVFVSDELAVYDGIFIHWERGAILSRGSAYTGLEYTMTDVLLDSYTFPATFNDMYKSSDGSRGHIVSGPNRFLGFLDLNGDNVWTEGEPMGLSTTLPSLVGWDSIDVEIPLTDSLFGYPRLAWNASTNNVTHYTVSFTVPMAGTQTFTVEAPRTFFHEGDILNAGQNGLNLGTGTDMSVSYRVYDSNNALITNGEFRVTAVGNTPRRTMRTKYPVQSTQVYGAVAELQWEMDWRNQGVRVTLRNEDTGETYINNQAYPLPIRHGLTTDDTYYYSLKPQLGANGRFVSLPAGTYSYTITELINTTGVTPQSVSGKFQLVTSDTNRNLYSISGTMKYFGKAQELVDSGTVLATADGSGISLTGSDLTGLTPGSISILVKQNGTTIETLNDVNADGVLKSESAKLAYSGYINYTTGEWSVSFSEPPAAGTTLVLATKRFESPVYIQAFSLPDEASSAVSIAGSPIAQIVTHVKGAFKIEGLKSGSYAIRAFLDSNGNGVCDEWETQGYAMPSSSQSPVLDSGVSPLVISEGNVTMTTLVLHDKDTDNDLLPDAWEYKMFGSLSDKSGYDQASPGIYIWQEYADGALDSDPRTPDTDLDGLTDAMEIMVTGTNTHEADTDADGISDLEEFLSGSDPNDANDAVPYQMPALAFDEDGVPYVDCTYPALRLGVILNYELQRKQTLDDPAWTAVCDISVGMTNVVASYGVDGATVYEQPAGTIRMKPAEMSDADFTSGFYRVKITADYGKMVDNGDGTCTYWTWVKSESNTWTYTAAATGEGTLVRDADGNWSFVTDTDSAKSGSLIRNEDGSWTFID